MTVPASFVALTVKVMVSVAFAVPSVAVNVAATGVELPVVGVPVIVATPWTDLRLKPAGKFVAVTFADGSVVPNVIDTGVPTLTVAVVEAVGAKSTTRSLNDCDVMTPSALVAVRVTV